MSIEGIFLSPTASEPMQSVQTGTLLAGKGLDGDRYCKHKGSYSVIRLSKHNPGEREPGRQLTHSVEDAFDRNNIQRPDSLGDLRRNIVIRGLTSEELLGSNVYYPHQNGINQEKISVQDDASAASDDRSILLSTCVRKWQNL